MRRETTEIRTFVNGEQTHESWLLIRANHIASSPGAHLFDSDIRHQHYVMMTVTRCTRRRDLNHDWLHNTEVLLEAAMSQAQWGAFVSSFGQGTGVPATLEYLAGVGVVPRAPVESRFDESHAEVREAGKRSLEYISRCYEALADAFENGGKKAQREALASLRYAIQNGPSNMEFAASSLTEHVEKVVTKARADIEGMALRAMEQGVISEPVTMFELEPGDVEEGV